MNINEVSFRFNENWELSEARLKDGTVCKSERVFAQLRQILLNTPECRPLPGAIVNLTQTSNSLTLRIQDKAFTKFSPPVTSMAQNLFSSLSKQEKARSIINQTGIKSLSEAFEELLKTDHPLIDKTLDHILAQKTPSEKDLRQVLKYIALEKVSQELEMQESELIEASANSIYTVKQSEIKDFIVPVDEAALKKNLTENKEKIKKLEARLAPIAAELVEVEGFVLRARTIPELKTEIPRLISQFAGQPFFQDALKLWELCLKILDMLIEGKDASWLRIPFLTAQLYSQQASLESLRNELQKKMPQNTYDKFAFLVFEFMMLSMSEATGEVFPAPHKEPFLSTLAVLKRQVSWRQVQIKQYKDENDQIRAIRKISRDRIKPKSVDAEYQLSRSTLKKYQNQQAPANTSFIAKFLSDEEKRMKLERQFADAKARLIRMMHL